MKVLAIESASTTASAALVSEEGILAEFTTNFQKTHSETLLPMVKECCDMTETSVNDVDAIAVSVGPGSFTGLRIGASTAKGLAFAAGKPIIPVPTLDAMAYGMFGSEFVLCPIMDARRGEVYTGLYSFDGTQFRVHESATACAIEVQAEKAKKLGAELGKKVCYLGDGVPVFKEKLKTLDETAVFAPAHLVFQKASSVATLGMKLLAEGVQESSFTFEPLYLRESQAERERREAGLSIEPKEE